MQWALGGSFDFGVRWTLDLSNGTFEAYGGFVGKSLRRDFGSFKKRGACNFSPFSYESA